MPHQLIVSMISIKNNKFFGMNDWFDLTKDNFVPYLFVLIKISIIKNVNTHIYNNACNFAIGIH